jgi:hypothetical protein
VTGPVEPAAVTVAPPARRWWRSRLFLLISVGAHLLFGLIAACVVVSHYSAARKLAFKAGPPSPNPAERALQHRVQLQQKTQSKDVSNTLPKRIVSTGLSKIELPALPALPKPEGGPPKMAAAGGATFGAVAGIGSFAGGTGAGTPINFFGIRDISSNVVIVVDVSDSMFGRTGDASYESRGLVRHGKEQNFQAVRDEAIALVNGLPPAANFGIVRFSGGAYPWQPLLVPATEENKRAATEHIQSHLDYHKAPKHGKRPGGTRHDYALEEAFKLKPEGGVIYLLTDGNATGDSVVQPGRKITAEDIFKVADDGQKSLRRRAKIHAIYYVTGEDKPDERQMLANLAGRNGGKFNSVQAKGRKM